MYNDRQFLLQEVIMKIELPNNIWSFLWRYFTYNPYSILALISIILLIGCIPAIDSYILKCVIDIASELQNASADEITSRMFKWAIIYPVFWESINWTWRLYDYVYLKTMTIIQAKAYSDLFGYTQYHSHNFFQNNLAGSIASRMSDTAKSIELVFAKILEFVLRRLATIFGAIYVMFNTHYVFGYIMAAWLGLFITINIIFYPNIRRHTAKFSKNRMTAVGKIVDVIYNISAVRMFSRKNFKYEYISGYINKIKDSQQDLQWFMCKLRYIQGVSCSLLIFIMSYYLIQFYSISFVTIGDFGLILSLSLAISDDMWDLTQELGDFFEELGICNQALSLATPHQITNIPNAKDLVVTNGEIKFKKVTFEYAKNRNIFNNQSITIKSGSKVGLVGYSGSGKTTFVNLITRLFDIQSGEILIDGNDIQKCTIESLNKSISFIPQNPILFHRSIRDNIRYGKLDATDKEIIEAAKKASIHNDIINMPDGYDNICGEGGGNLSGGQKQRIVIARSFLKDTKILILDEATSALDTLHEKLVQKSLATLMKDKTVIIIAHRLATLAQMDRILVFDKGHIVEDGMHDSLISKNGLYSDLWHSQYDGFLMDDRKNDK